MIKGVLLCGGKGSRMAPITKIINKNLLPVGDRPLVYHCIQKFKDAGITDIMITCGSFQFGQIVELLGSGHALGVELTYRVQEEPKGICDAIRLAKDFTVNNPFIVMLGDNIIDDKVVAQMKKSLESSDSAYVAVKEVPDPERFGVVKYKADGSIDEIIEKPQIPPSHDAVVGLYGYHPCAYDKIAQLRPSGRGEYEVTDLNNAYLREGRLATTRLDGYWIDAGTHNALFEANSWFWSQKKGQP